MRKLLGLVIVLVLVFVLAWFLSRRAAAPAIVSVPSTEPVVVEAKNVELTPLEDSIASDESASPARVPATIVPPAGAAPPRPELTEIRGRLLLASGEPALGVKLKLSGHEGNAEHVRRYGLPQNWEDIATTNDSDGRFSIRFDPPRAFQFFLETKSKGHCEANWRWGELEPHSVVDVGDVTLVRGGSVNARIVDKNGRVLTKGWSVYADAQLRDHSNGRDETRVIKYSCDSRGGFVLPGLPPGRVHLQAYSEVANWVEGPTVDVVENHVTAADILYDAPSVEGRISVVVFTPPFYIFEFEDNFDFVIRGLGIEERKASKVPNSSQMFTFPDLPAGLYEIELRDERFQPWSRSDVKPGTSVDARLKGNASAVLIVTDAATREPVNRYALDVRFDKSNSSPNSFRILEPKKDPPAGGRFTGLIPVTQTFIVRADGFSVCELSLPDLRPNEERKLVALLTRASGLTGRVVSGPGSTPIERAVVTLVPIRPNAGEHQIFRSKDDPDALTTESDAGGRFEFRGVSVGKYNLTASLTRFFSVERALSVDPGSTAQDVELPLPPRAWLSGKLLAPEGTSFAGLTAIAIPKSVLDKDPHAERNRIFFGKDDAATDIGADGTFRLGPLPPGEVQVTVRMPDSPYSHGTSGWSTVQGRGIEVGNVMLEPNGETVQEFDFRSWLPGTIEIQATVNGRPASAFRVNIDDPEHRGTAAILQLDSKGMATSKPLAPGSYEISVYPEGSSVPSVTKQRRDLAPGEAAKVSLSWNHVSGTVRVLDDATGKPLAGQRVTIGPDSDRFGMGTSLDCDKDGVARLELVVGRYRIAIANEHSGIGPNAGVVIDWLESGPASKEIRLRPK